MQISLLNVIFGRCTAETLVTLNVSNLYTNKDETILQTKPFTAFLNRNSRIKRGQPHNIYNIIITDPKQRQSLCFFCFWVGLANRRWGGFDRDKNQVR